MDENLIEKKIEDVVNELSMIPRRKQTGLFKSVNSNSNQLLQQKMDKVQDSLEYLRVSVKYLQFDLEATRRENQYLRKMLDK